MRHTSEWNLADVARMDVAQATTLLSGLGYSKDIFIPYDQKLDQPTEILIID